jgi:hypothetical protein
MRLYSFTSNAKSTQENVLTLASNIILEVTGSIFNTLCQDARNSQPRTHGQIGCILGSALACAFTKASEISR